MNYILISCMILAVCIAAAVFLTKWISRRKKLRRPVRILTAAGLSVGFFAAVALVYLQNYYHADAEAAAALQSDADVTVTEEAGWYFFDGAGQENALIFYQGAKVEETAYAPLLHRLAQEGVDCFLVKMPFRFAILNRSAADQVMAEYDYASWYLAGHSLGGSTAAMYAADHAQELDGLILLAAYPTRPLSDDLKFVSVYGSEDGCLNRESYGKNRNCWPAGGQEVCIEGGNHAQFGNYGKQASDGEAAISASSQQEQTAAAILACIGI